MSSQPANALAIIPARGGSKRIPRKNIRSFLGKPIIGYVIETALQSGLFAEVMVSTDDDEIAAIAKEFGARVPFRRSEETANDTATTAAVLQEVLASYEALDRTFGIACCLYPTAPFVTYNLLKQAFELLKTGNFDTVMPVQQFGFPIQRALRVENTNKRLDWVQPEHALTRSQDLEPAYHDAGQFYMFDVARFRQTARLLTDNTTGIVISEMMAQDIDNEDDWRLAEMKYRLINP